MITSVLHFKSLFTVKCLERVEVEGDAVGECSIERNGVMRLVVVKGDLNV